MSFESKVVDQVVGRYHRLGNGQPDLNIIAQGEGIKVRDLTGEGPFGASGWFRLEGPQKQPVILINREKSESHQRFTFAHELGHYFMGHGSRPRDTREQLHKRDAVEFSANRFAAELLMPEKKVRELVRQMKTTQEMARVFEVSEQAMHYRLLNLGYSV